MDRMIPAKSEFLSVDLDELNQPSKTYKMNIDAETVVGTCDDLDAMKQAIYKILNTERYRYLIYSWNYGVELDELFGEPISYCIPEIERRITDALMNDDRIVGVTDFEFETKGRIVSTTFKVSTTFGEINVEKDVEI